jgi:hypothetical protein
MTSASAAGDLLDGAPGLEIREAEPKRLDVARQRLPGTRAFGLSARPEIFPRRGGSPRWDPVGDMDDSR